MPTEEQKTVNERREYFKLMKPRYQKATRSQQSALLSEMRASSQGCVAKACFGSCMEKAWNARSSRKDEVEDTNWQ